MSNDSISDASNAKTAESGSQAGSVSSDELLSKLPTKGFVRRKVLMKKDDPTCAKQSAQNAEAIIIKATKPMGKGKQPTVIPLTKDQIDAVLRSLKVPVPVNKGSEVDNSVRAMIVQSSETFKKEKEPAEMRIVNENTPIVTVNTPDKGAKRPISSVDVIPPEKRVKLDFQSPCSEDDSSPHPSNHVNLVSRFRKTVSDAIKPSPQRALHLAPEFAHPAEKMTPEGDASNVDSGFTEIGDDDKPQPKRIEIIFNDSSVQSNNVTSVSAKSFDSATVTQSNAQTGSMVNQQGQNIVQITGQSTATILHLPIVNIQGQGQQKIGQPLTLPVTVPPNVQIVQAGQQLVQLPITMSPNTSAGSSSTSPRVITYTIPTTQSNMTVTNLQLVPQSTTSAGSPISSLIRPIATKAVPSPKAGSQIVASQFLDKSSFTYINKTPGGFIPIANANLPKILVSSNPSGEVTTAGSVAVDSLKIL